MMVEQQQDMTKIFLMCDLQMNTLEKEFSKMNFGPKKGKGGGKVARNSAKVKASK